MADYRLYLNVNVTPERAQAIPPSEALPMVLFWALAVRRCELGILEPEMQNRLRLYRIRSFAGWREGPIPCRTHGGAR
jgi:hypothetical protein